MKAMLFMDWFVLLLVCFFAAITIYMIMFVSFPLWMWFVIAGNIYGLGIMTYAVIEHANFDYYYE